jgi:hypothetical protein
MTVVVISKVLSGDTPVQLSMSHAAASGTAKVYRLTASNAIQRLSDIGWANGVLTDTAPAQSITLYVLPQ